jgi:predicted PurR-regulated permease PerM
VGYPRALIVLVRTAAALWGLLVFLTNSIPYLGSWIGLGSPALLALPVGDRPLLLAVVAVFPVVNCVLIPLVRRTTSATPWGRSVSVTPVAPVLWGWLLGSARRVHLLRTRTDPPDPGDAADRTPPPPPADEES